ncbi:MAG: fimbrillin family protein [Bacteroidaceae bacterium]|nr:fimbrillin family protein [Bacteroidaceae bacterium]
MKRNPLWLIAAVIFFGCSEQLSEVLVSPDSLPINLTGSINQQNVTRANEQGFVTGDRMGIYIVDYVDGQPEQISTDNRASNVIYTFDGENYRWTAPTTIYWRDNTTPVDVYGYYPSANYISDPTAYRFEVSEDQNLQREGEMGNYEASDFLWGKTTNVSPTTEAIIVRYSHRLAGVRVHLIKGEGMTDTEWEKLPRLVTIDNTVRIATIDLSTGTATPSGSYDHPIRMLEQTSDYRAVVIPQTVEAGKALISITIDGISYSHKIASPMNYQAGKLHNFTISVNKSEATGDYSISVSDDGITDWVNDEASHQFSAQAYVVVHCDKYGTLKDCITRAGLDYKTIQNLKVTGEVNDVDFNLINGEMSELKHLNLKDIKIKHVYHSYWTSDDNGSLVEYYIDDELPSGAFYGNKSIRSMILPSSLKEIGGDAFREMRLMYSTLEIPEGVTKIGGSAFAYNEYNGVELILPATIDTIEGAACADCGWKCELKLTDNIKYIGGDAFGGWYGGCPNFYGVFHIPAHLTELNERIFSGLGSNGSFTGELEIPQGFSVIPYNAFGVSLKNRVPLRIPQGVKRIETQAFPLLSSIHFNDDLEEIGHGAFYDGSFYFPIELPSQLRILGTRAFWNARIEGVLAIPESCLSIEEGAFSLNNITKVILPSKLENISAEMFCGCGMLKEISIPKYVEFIDRNAFTGCGALQTIICLNPEPPALGTDVFHAGEMYSTWSDIGVDFDKCILQVPEASIEAYRHADGWNEFKNITPYRELAFNIPEIVALDKGSTLEGILRAEGAWEVSECPDWVIVSPTSGTYKEELTVTVKPMNYEGERDGRIVFRLKEKDYTYYTTVHQYNSAEYREDETYVLQQASAGAPQEVPLFIVGEGYTAEEIVSGQYLSDMKEQMEHLFSCEPYKTYRNYFTVSTAIACSPEHGLDGRTRFDSGIDYYNWLFYTDENRVWEYAESHAKGINGGSHNRTVVMMLMNTNQLPNAVKLADDGYALAMLGKSNDVYPFDQRDLVLRDLGGRAFGHLATEAINHFTFLNACTCPGCRGWEDYQHAKRLGWFENIATTGKMNEVPWSHLIFEPKYAAYVDMYEGAYNHARGTYRSENMSVMGNVPIPYFNTISRESIVRRIKRYAGQTFSFEDFMVNDKIEIPEE